MSRMTEQIDHGPEVVRESYYPTLEAVTDPKPPANNQYNTPRASTPPYASPLPFSNDKNVSTLNVATPANPKSSQEQLSEKHHLINQPTNQKRLPFGLSTLGFGVVVALITAIIVGGAAGGGLGAVIASKNNDLTKANEALTVAQNAVQSLNQTAAPAAPDNSTCSNNTVTSDNSTITTVINLSNYTVEPAKNVENLFLDCPNIAANQFTTKQNEKFSLYCRSAWKSGLAAAQGGVVADMVYLVAYTVEDCMEACSGFNFEQRRWNGTARCRAMNFRANMADKIRDVGGNCWLKNDTVADVSAAPIEDGVISGHIVE